MSFSTAVLGDDFGNAIPDATTIPLTSQGSGNQNGHIERAGDQDMFRVVAPVSGLMTITQNAVAGSSLDTYLYVYDSQGREIARNDDSNGSLNSRVQVQVTAGATYFVQADAFSTSSGQYSLSFSTAALGDDFGNTIPEAATIPLSSSGNGSQNGHIERAGDQDMFRIVAPVSGLMTITQDAAPGSPLDSYVYVYDSQGREIVSDDDTGPGFNSQTRINVTAGATYFVRAGTSAPARVGTP